MLTVIAFIIILALMIFVHELGHFVAAKRNGVKVEEFGFGFPPRIWGIKKGETIYSMNWIPLGGFVKIYGEDGEDRSNHHSFSSKKIWRRAIILSAGVLMNFLLGALLLSFGFMYGLPNSIDDSAVAADAKVQISQIAPDSPAGLAGLKVGDQIIKLTGPSGEASNITKVYQVQNFISENKGKLVSVEIKRGKTQMSLALTPRENPPENEGAMGVNLARVSKISYPWYKALYEGFKQTFILIWVILSMFGYLIGQIFTGGSVAGDVAGPVGIYSITGQAAQMGFIYLLQLTAILSINLGLVNALPIPALDGGRLLFLLIEKIKGSPISQRFEKSLHTAGFVFLILLMLLISIKDIMKLF